MDDDTQTRRRINLTWISRKRGDLPPDNWFSQVEGEVNYQKGGVDPLRKLVGGGFLG